MIELRLATEAEKRARDVLTHAAWGQRLTVEQYLARELRLRAHPWCVENMRTWLLVDDGEVVASLETFNMEGRAGGEALRPCVEGVASVFVEERLRGRGYAGALMARLNARLKDEGRLAVLLYSDVGASLYERSGYVARPAFERVFASEPGDPANVCDRVFGEQDLARELAAARVPEDRLLVWPNASQLDWHLERERIYAELLARPRPRFHGAVAGGASAFFCGDLKNDRLVILTLAGAREDEARATLQAAQRVAHAAKLPKVVLWECAWPFTLRDGERRERTDGIPMICPLRPGVDAAAWGNTSRSTWI